MRWPPFAPHPGALPNQIATELISRLRLLGPADLALLQRADQVLCAELVGDLPMPASELGLLAITLVETCLHRCDLLRPTFSEAAAAVRFPQPSFIRLVDTAASMAERCDLIREFVALIPPDHGFDVASLVALVITSDEGEDSYGRAIRALAITGFTLWSAMAGVDIRYTVSTAPDYLISDELRELMGVRIPSPVAGWT